MDPAPAKFIMIDGMERDLVLPVRQINDIHAQWHPEVNAWIVDMSAANGTFLVLGAFQEMDRHRSFETVSDQIEFDRTVESEINALDRPDWPYDLDDLTARDLGLALWKEITLDPGSRQQYSFYYAVASSAEEALSVAQQAREPTTADAWFDETQNAYEAWLQKSTPVETPDAGLRWMASVQEDGAAPCPGLWNDDRSGAAE